MLTALHAANAYTAARPAVAPREQSGIIARLGAAADDFARQMAQVDAAGTGVMAGQVETHHLVQAIAESQLAMETVVAIRDKVVEAYQEILRMPV